MCGERLLLRWLLGSVVNKGAFLQKPGLQAVKLWTQMQMKQEVFSLADVSSSDGCDM